MTTGNDKIAFLIAAHGDPTVLKRLVYALDYEKFDIYIHIDKKSDISAFGFDSYSLKHSRLTVLDDRVKVYWAGISQVDALLKMCKAAKDVGGYIRYVTLSGNDYPLKSNWEIYETLKAPDKEFIMGNKEEAKWKYTDYFFKSLGVFGKVLTRVLRLLHVKRKPLKVDGKDVDIYFAPSWYGLSAECIDYTLNQLERHGEYMKYFRHVFAPDELLVPTIVFNSPKFKERTLRSDFPAGTHYNEKPALHYINYEPVVQVFKAEDYPKLMSSGKLFTRKVRSGVSDSLMDMIDESRTENNL